MAKRRGNNRRPQREVKKNPHKINDEIRANNVRLVGDGEPIEMSLSDAKKIAEDKGMDLVLMNGNVDPAIVKIMNYSKYLYELNKKRPQNKSLPMKEMRFRPQTDENDLKFKTKHIINFLKKGHKVKAFVFFKGREMAYQEQGEKLLLQLAVELEDYAIVEKLPKMEGRKMNMFLKPKPQKNEGGTNKQD